MNPEKLQKSPKEKILIVEDSDTILFLLKEICTDMGFDVTTAENGLDALNILKKEKFSLYIVDLMMPIMNGWEFIPRLFKLIPDAIVLVQTAVNNPDDIIKIMKLGIYDYILKPLEADLFQLTIEKAMEIRRLRNMQLMIEENSEFKLKGQLEWFAYKDQISNAGQENREYRYLQNLKTTLAQGNGFGATVSLIELIESLAKETEEGYIIPKDLTDMVFKTNHINKRLFEGLDKIINLIKEKKELQEILTSDLISEIPEIVKKYEEKYQAAGITVSISKLKANKKLNIDKDNLLLVIEEMLINAINYGGKNSRVQFFFYFKDGYFRIAIKNDLHQGGIPAEFEKIVFEPFVRINQITERIIDYENVALGLGLGLTIAQNIVRKNDGLFYIYNVKDFSDPFSSECVLAEILLPYKS